MKRAASLALLLALAATAQDAPPRGNMVGSYGPWLADKVLGSDPGRLSFRAGKWTSVYEWRRIARQRVLDRIAPVDLGGLPEVRVESRHTIDGLDIELLSWQLPAGPRTEAVFLKPAGADGPLPAILALHDHGGNKFLGWRKIVRTNDHWEIQKRHQSNYVSDRLKKLIRTFRTKNVLVYNRLCGPTVAFPFTSPNETAKSFACCCVEESSLSEPYCGR